MYGDEAARRYFREGRSRIVHEESDDDISLVRAATRGDSSAFEALLLRYRAYIYAIAYNVVRDVDDALDVTQGVYLKLLEKLGDYNGSGPFRGWLGTITAREAVSHLRRNRRREVAVEPERLASILDGRRNASAEDVRGDIDHRDRMAAVEERLDSLSGQQRSILVLMVREDMAPGEISARLRIPARQVSTQIHRAFVKLREALAPRPREEAPPARGRGARRAPLDADAHVAASTKEG